MKRRKTRLAALLLVVLLSLTLGACKVKKSDDNASEPAVTESGTEQTAAPREENTEEEPAVITEETEEAGAAEATASGDGPMID